jgi:phospholipid/cholesterol/gamma-HCH transport system substrate-binding protein
MRGPTRLLKAMRGRTGRQAVKLAVYAAVCLVVLAGLVSRIGNIDFFAKRTSYQAVMPDVTGLIVNDEVKVAGVGVGKVTGIKVERGQAVVSFEVDRDVKIPKDSRVGLRWRNVLGQKYLYLYPGEGERLPSGGRLPIEQAADSADVGAFLNAIGPILRAIDPDKANSFIHAFNDALEGNEEEVRGLLADTADIATELGGADEEIGALIEDLDVVVGGLAARDEDLQAVITRFSTMAGGLAENNDDLQLLVERFAAVQQKLDELVTGNRANLDETIANLVVIADVLGDHREDLDRALATLPQGLEVYDVISSYGQWFQIRIRISCMANQRSCTDEAITTEGISGSPAADAGVVPAFALSGGGL